MTQNNRPVIINTPDAPQPGGHYSQALIHNGLVYVSGLLPVKPGGEKVKGSIEEQISQVLANLEAILKAAGLSRNHVLKTTIYISDVELWGRVNKIYSEFFDTHKPARAIVPVKPLHFGFSVELEATAAIF